MILRGTTVIKRDGNAKRDVCTKRDSDAIRGMSAVKEGDNAEVCVC